MVAQGPSYRAYLRPRKPGSGHKTLRWWIPLLGREALEHYSSIQQRSKEDIDYVGEAMARVLEEMESTVRFLPCK